MKSIMLCLYCHLFLLFYYCVVLPCCTYVYSYVAYFCRFLYVNKSSFQKKILYCKKFNFFLISFFLLVYGLWFPCWSATSSVSTLEVVRQQEGSTVYTVTRLKGKWQGHITTNELRYIYYSC